MPVKGEAVLGHYASIAGTGTEYDTEVEKEVVDTFIRCLEILPHHYVVDLGAGSCLVASAIAQRVGLRKAVLCVDPSQEMLDMGRGLPGVQTHCSGDMAWINTMKEKSVDRIFIRQAVHHFDQERLRDIFGGILKMLKPGGKLCISKRGDLEEMFDWPEGFYEDRSKEEIPIEGLREILREVGFSKFMLTKQEKIVDTPKTELYPQFRKRFISWFSLLTDQEIEAGIDILESRHKGKTAPVLKRENFLVALI
eukprot:GFUD01121391.1.p1 GENE.GFUD01121391.1~~GFUD01121391.1.p1  ORF type:complete len:252 (+),score=69.08 GFUD01121391.1:84-839(+)